MSVLKLDDGRLRRVGWQPAQPGSGPHQIAFHPDGELLFVANELDASVACYGYDASKGKIVRKLGQAATAVEANIGGVVMAVDPAGDFLYTAHRRGSAGVSMWRIAQNTGGLQRLQTVDRSGPRLHEITTTADGGSLLGLSREQGGVFGWRVANGQMSRGVQLVSLEAPRSIAVKSL